MKSLQCDVASKVRVGVGVCQKCHSASVCVSAKRGTAAELDSLEILRGDRRRLVSDIRDLFPVKWSHFFRSWKGRLALLAAVSALHFSVDARVKGRQEIFE
eukprot:g69097.t1